MVRFVQFVGVRKKDMLGIFDDEQRQIGQIWPNPDGTRHLSPLDGVMKRLKCPALRHVSCLASNKRGHAGTAIVILNGP